MQQAKWISHSFVKCLVIWERLGSFSIEKLVDFRNIQDLHGALLQEIFHQRERMLFARLDPDIAFSCI